MLMLMMLLWGGIGMESGNMLFELLKEDIGGTRATLIAGDAGQFAEELAREQLADAEQLDKDVLPRREDADGRRWVRLVQMNAVPPDAVKTQNRFVHAAGVGVRLRDRMIAHDRGFRPHFFPAAATAAAVLCTDRSTAACAALIVHNDDDPV